MKEWYYEMSEFITRLEYEEHNLRMEDEHKRQIRRIDQLEKDSKTQTQT